MSMPGGGPQSRDPGAQRWGAEQEQINKAAEQSHLAHELERAEAERAAEDGVAPPVAKKPWWKFWA
jgi:hypothetical protein